VLEDCEGARADWKTGSLAKGWCQTDPFGTFGRCLTLQG
jgi:hypothetical protein